MPAFNLFFDGLPTELQKIVYEYDSTHRICDKEQFALEIRGHILYKQVKNDVCPINHVIESYVEDHYGDWYIDNGYPLNEETLQSSGAYSNSYGYFCTAEYDSDPQFRQKIRGKIPFYFHDQGYDLYISPPFNGVLYFKFLPKGTLDRVAKDDPMLQAPYDGYVVLEDVLLNLTSNNRAIQDWNSNLLGYKKKNFNCVMDWNVGREYNVVVCQVVDSTCNDLLRWERDL